jgi:cell division protein FtsW
LIGALIILLVFAVFLWRGMRAALRSSDRFGMLLGIGIVVGIVAQALLNMSVVLALVPTKGIPLPFISYGGSSLVPTLAGVGILLNISQYAVLGKRTRFDEDGDEDEYPEQRRAKKQRAPRQRAANIAQPRYG